MIGPNRLSRRTVMIAGALAPGLAAAKAPTAPGPGRGAWRTCSPEAHGLSTPALRGAADKLAAKGERQGLVVIRRGVLVFEAYWKNDYHLARPDWPNVSFSSGKSWGSAMVGRAVTEGLLKTSDLVAKYHDVMVQMRAVNAREILVADRVRKVQTNDLGTDAAGQWTNLERLRGEGRCWHSRGGGHELTPGRTGEQLYRHKNASLNTISEYL